MIGALPCSFFLVTTGPVGVGKTFQIESVLKAQVDGEPIASPALYVLAEASAEGTAAETLQDPERALVWPATDCEQATDAFRICFPPSSPLTLGAARRKLHELLAARAAIDKQPAPPKPEPTPSDHLTLRAGVIDTGSSLYKGSVSLARERFIAESEARNRGKAGKKEAPYNNDMNLHGYAARVCGDMIGMLNTACTMHRGLVVMVSVHTGPVEEKLVIEQDGRKEVVTQVVGHAPRLGAAKPVKRGINVPAFSTTWDGLAAKANAVVHCYETVPDLTNVSSADLNAEAARHGPRHGLITARLVHPDLGPVMWTKRQGGEGPLGIFSLLPAVWHPDVPCDPAVKAISPTPDLGAMLAFAVKQHRDEQARKAKVTS